MRWPSVVPTEHPDANGSPPTFQKRTRISRSQRAQPSGLTSYACQMLGVVGFLIETLALARITTFLPGEKGGDSYGTHLETERRV
jgi:hypothetical protein